MRETSELAAGIMVFFHCPLIVTFFFFFLQFIIFTYKFFSVFPYYPVVYLNAFVIRTWKNLEMIYPTFDE